MKGDIHTARTRHHGWRKRWEATSEILPFAWVVGYGFTRRRALRALRERMEQA